MKSETESVMKNKASAKPGMSLKEAARAEAAKSSANEKLVEHHENVAHGPFKWYAVHVASNQEL